MKLAITIQDIVAAAKPFAIALVTDTDTDAKLTMTIAGKDTKFRIGDKPSSLEHTVTLMDTAAKLLGVHDYGTARAGDKLAMKITAGKDSHSDERDLR